MSDRLRFGIFMGPFHPPGESPTYLLERDLRLIEHLDRLDWDEAWIGEHHSAGTEIIASPEIFVAAAAQRTRHIKLGTGVVSVSYHNPLWVADRAVLLDHLTRGRFMLGLGPGSLPTDAAMIGLDQHQTRDLLAQGVDIIMQLLRTDDPVTFENDRWTLRDARLQLRPYSDPLFDVSVAAVASPTGPQLAGKNGIGLLSIGATQAGRVRCARPALGRDGGAGRPLRHHRRSGQVAAGRADAHRRHSGTGDQGRRARHRAVVQVFPEPWPPFPRWRSAATTSGR